MEKKPQASPLIIIGMHRSGTSMTARLLESLGVFMGWKKQGDHEALFFNHLNEWMFDQSGADWDRPDPVVELLAHDQLCAHVESYLRITLASPRCVAYLGPSRYLRYRSMLAIREPWGWKDPRTTYVLPMWMRLFPDAKVLHVLRHGVDVAQSLKARNARNLERIGARTQRVRFKYQFLPKRKGFLNSVRCETLEGGLELWREYVERAGEVIEPLGDRALEIRYEDLLARPTEVLPEIARFTGIEASTADVERASERVDAGRAFAYRRSAELSALAERESTVLALHGYALNEAEVG
ncbi:MAG: sulfotransferase [Planctomycetota bacterium]